MKKIGVSGGEGFIASYVIQELQARGYKVVTNVINNSWKSDEIYKDILKDCDVYNIDIRDSAGMMQMIGHCDSFIHLAGILGTRHVENAWNFYDINLKGAINILDALREFKIPGVFISVGNYFEHNNYSNSKVAAEREVFKYAKFLETKANVVRALNAVGARQKVRNTGKIMATFITQALRSEPINVYGGKDNCSIMDMVYAGDIAKVLCNVLLDLDKYYPDLKNKYGNLFEAGTGVGYSVYEIAEMVKQMTGSSSQIIEVPMRDGESERSKVVAENPFPIDYKPLKEIIKETIDFYKKNEKT